MEAALGRLAAKGVDGRRLVEAAVATWRAVFAALAPIIGDKGVSALFMRSVHLTRGKHSWLADVVEAAGADPLETLEAVSLAQSTPIIAAGNGALLDAFHSVLAALIGTSLTDRLLRPAWQLNEGGLAVQDPST